MLKPLLYLLLGLTLGGSALAEELERIVAVVNEEVIVDSRLQREIRGVEAELRQQATRLPSPEVLRRQVLERLVLSRLQLQLAERNSIKVDDGELNDAVRNVAAENNLSLEQFRQALDKEELDFAEFRENLREQLTIRRLQQRQVVSRVNVTDQEIANFIANQAQQGNTTAEYHLLHILIALPDAASPEVIKEKQQKARELVDSLRAGADFQATAVAVSDSQQALEGGDLGWRKAGEVPSLFAGLVARMSVGDIEGPIRNAGGFHILKLAGIRSTGQSVVTQTRARHILIKTSELISDQEAESKLAQLRERILHGDDFTELARAHSEDPASAAEGGALGWISPGVMVSEFEEVMDSLKTNQISQPFRSRFGWHILQVLERREHDNTEEALRTRASKQIRQRKIEEELQNWLRQLRDEAYVEYRLE
jgi:peptidyl-prolyl cis-trans isomerase SurA